jgi:hypothetical protein
MMEQRVVLSKEGQLAEGVTLDYIRELATDYERAIKAAQDGHVQLAQVEEALERAEAMAIAVAYENGDINGKNAAERTAQEALVVERDGDVRALRDLLKTVRRDAAGWEADERAAYRWCKLTEAWLYARGGGR